MAAAQREPWQCEQCGFIIPIEVEIATQICPQCRERSPSFEQVRAERSKGFRILFALFLIVAVFLVFMFQDFARLPRGASYWMALPFIIAAVMLGLVVVIFAVLIVVASTINVVRARRFKSEPYVLAVARKAAGEEGELIRSGPMTIWYSGKANPVAMLMEQIEEAPPPRIGCGTRIRSSTRCTRLVLRQAQSLRGVRQVIQPACSELASILGWPLSGPNLPHRHPLHRGRSPVASAILRRRLDRFSVLTSWRFSRARNGCLAENGNRQEPERHNDELARLNRKMIVSLSRGTALGIDLFDRTDKKIGRHLIRWADYRHFQSLEQFRAESWSMFEYLAGRQAPQQRRDRLRASSMIRNQMRIHERLERHFGFGFGPLVESWRQWVKSRGIGTFAPLQQSVREKVLNLLVPLIIDRQAKQQDRILAIRKMGSEGYVVGADTLIGLLGDDDMIPMVEVVWALESISGMTHGDDRSRWMAWWNSLPAEIRGSEKDLVFSTKS